MSYELNVENVTADPYSMTKERQEDTQLYAKTIEPNVITQTYTQKGWVTKQIAIKEITNQREEININPSQPVLRH